MGTFNIKVFSDNTICKEAFKEVSGTDQVNSLEVNEGMCLELVEFKEKSEEDHFDIAVDVLGRGD